MAFNVTVINTKGGSGKTTLSANLGGILADLKQRTLLVDADTGQPALSSYFALKEQAPSGLTQLFLSDPNNMDKAALISKTNIENLDLIYSDDPNAKLQSWVLEQPDGRMRLKSILKQFDCDYDYIIIDTRGSVGGVQDAAAIAGDIMISPIPPEMLSAREFIRGTVELLQRLLPLEDYGFRIGNLHGVINKMNRTIDARQIVRELRSDSFERTKGRVTVCDTVIPDSVLYREAATRKIPVHHVSRLHSDRTGDIILALVKELLPNLSNMELTTNTSSYHGKREVV